MKVLVFSSSPNTDGLTAVCANAALEVFENTPTFTPNHGKSQRANFYLRGKNL